MSFPLWPNDGDTYTSLAGIGYRFSSATSSWDIITQSLGVTGLQISGEDTDKVTTKASDTNWEQLQVQATPTANGLFEVECWAYWSAAAAYVYVDSEMTVT